MRVISRSMAIFILGIIGFFVFLSPSNTWAASKEYYISNINIEAKVDDKGNMNVEETYRYNFTGKFNGIKRNVKTKGSDGVEDVKVSIVNNNKDEFINESNSENNNTFQLNKSSSETEVKIFSQSQDEEKVFKIRYTLKNVVTSYSDLSELKWVFFENEDDVKIDNITVFLTLPNEITKEVTYSGEGPKRGELRNIDNKYIRLTLNDMENNDVIGASVLFPSTWINTSKVVDKTYDEYSKEAKKQKTITTVVIASGISIAILLITIPLYLSSKRRKKAIDKYREDYVFFNGNLYEDIPSDLTPALVSILVNGRIDINDFLATILYLSNKGIIKFEGNYSEDDYEDVSISIDENHSSAYLLDSEKYLIGWLKGYMKNGKVKLSKLQKVSKSESFREEYSSWENVVDIDAENLNFYTNILGKQILTNEYEDERLKWRAFERYFTNLNDVDDLKDLNIWSRILPYAIALDIFDDVQDFIKGDSNYYDSYNPMYNYGFMYFYASSYHDNFNHNFSSSDSSSSTSNFSGGSGGGGFGGGGGSSAF
ncbi:DUF2207 domain-containing protein [Clostridium sp. YIM B02506]|uniref:DUF2207 domain-containing protein n=1 Tax=Clostridium sp. YIM B02506 TaxID=2910680 RepID=UPI001EEEA782|nr:DUF2207 domain-containing protein [Clostridium sp. YIM B02506]